MSSVRCVVVRFDKNWHDLSIENGLIHVGVLCFLERVVEWKR